MTVVCERTGLGSALGVGEGNVGAVALEVRLAKGSYRIHAFTLYAWAVHTFAPTPPAMWMMFSTRLYEGLGVLEHLRQPSMTSVELQRVYEE